MPVAIGDSGDVFARALRALAGDPALGRLPARTARRAAGAGALAPRRSRLAPEQPRRVAGRGLARRDLPRRPSPTRRAGSRATRSSTRRSTTGSGWRWRCAASRSRTSRSATRASTSPTADTICRGAAASCSRHCWPALGKATARCDYPRGQPSLPPLFRGRPVLDAGEMRRRLHATASKSARPTRMQVVGSGTAHSISGAASSAATALPPAPRARSPSPGITGSRRRSATELVVDAATRELRVDALRRECGACSGGRCSCARSAPAAATAARPRSTCSATSSSTSSRFGIQFVASPRHADGLLVTGPVTANMKEAVLRTYEAVAEPKLVIAAGACAISGGTFAIMPKCATG